MISIRLALSIGLALIFSDMANAATGFITGEQISGFNKICYYNVLGSAYTITIGAAQLCPLNIQTPNPAPMPAIGLPTLPGRIGYLKGEVRQGMNKVCYYDVLGSTATLTFSAVSLCPLNHSF